MTENEAPKEELVVLFPEIELLKAKSKEYIPKLKAASAKATEKMQEWLNGGELQDDDERVALNDFLANIRSSGQKMQSMRMEITKPIDNAVSSLIALEKPLLDSDKNSLYNQLRAMITRYDQRILEEKQRIEREAEQRKIRDNARIDIKAVILKNLNDLTITKAKNAETWSKAYFDQTTLETWDKRADDFMKMRPNLKREDYDNMFTINFADKMKAAQFTEADPMSKWIDELKKVETYEKWNKEVLDACTPILNEWRGKIPDMKADLIRLNNIKDEQQRQEAIRQQQAQAEAETQRRNTAIEQQAIHKSLQVDANAQLDKLENSFREQASIQDAPDAGSTKFVLKFDDIPRAYQPFVTIIYHVMASKKFDGIVKRDKLGEQVVDAKGRPEYIPQVQWWIDQFLKHVDADVPGTKVFEEAKTIIRK